MQIAFSLSYYYFVIFWLFFSLMFLGTVINAQGPVAQALFLGDQSLFNTTREDCVWKRGNDRDQCPDPDVFMTLFTPKNIRPKSKVNGCFIASLFVHLILF